VERARRFSNVTMQSHFIALLVRPEQGVKLLGLLLAGSTGQHMQVCNMFVWAGLIYMASKGLGWAGGSHFEIGTSSVCHWSLSWLLVGGAACPHLRLTLMRPFGNGKWSYI
jgi:hypothetical protein